MRSLLAIVLAAAVLLTGQSGSALALGNWPSAPFAVPTNSYIGYWVWGTWTGSFSHTGADLWDNTSGAGNIGSGVRMAYAGTVKTIHWICKKSDGTYISRSYNCINDSGVQYSAKYGATILTDYQSKVTHYWHMARQETMVSNMSDIAVDAWYPMGTFLGYQGNATAVADTVLHLHFTVGTNVNSDTYAYSVDPTPYVGPRLKEGDREPVHVQGTWCTKRSELRLAA